MSHEFLHVQNDILRAVFSMQFTYSLPETVEQVLDRLEQLGIAFNTCSIYLSGESESIIHYRLYPVPAGLSILSPEESQEISPIFAEKMPTTSHEGEVNHVNVPTPIGILALSRVEAPYTERDVSTLMAVADTIVTIAVRHQDLLRKEELESAVMELDENLLRLHNASASLFAPSQPEILERVIHLATQSLGYDRCGVFLKDDTRGILQGQLGIDEKGELEDISSMAYPLAPSTPEETMILCQVVNGELPFFLTQDLAGEGYQVAGGQVASNAAVPMRTGAEIVGVLCVDNLFSRRPIPQSEIASLMVLANKAANAVVNLMRLENEQRFQEQLTILHEVGNELSRANTLDELCRHAVELGRERLGFDRLSIWFTNEDRTTIDGMFGTDENGQLRDERGKLIDVQPGSLLEEIFKGKKRSALAHDAPLFNDQGKMVATGEVALAPLWDGRSIIGFLSTDNLLLGESVTEHHAEILTLYASALGHLCLRVKAEEALRESEEKYRILIESAEAAIFSLNEEGVFLFMGRTAARALGGQPEDFVGKTLWDCFPQAMADAQMETIRQVIRSGQGCTVENETMLQGQSYWFRTGIHPIRDSSGEIESVVGIATDITERIKVEAELQESEEKYRDWFENASDLIQSVAPDGRFRYVNRAWQETLGYSQEELPGLSFLDIIHPDHHAHCMEVFRQIMSGKQAQIETQFVSKTGETHLVEGTVNCRFVDGDPISTRGIFRDVTERKQAELEVQASLEEKEVLLKEIHHRVKNNLQVIASMLNMQTRYTEDEQTIAQLVDSRNRVYSMALVHDNLYRSESLARVDLAAYITDLASNLSQSYDIEHNRVKLKLDVEHILLTIDQAVPCGLILNELVSNALKHAFPDILDEQDTVSREIQIGLRTTEDGMLSLSVADNGMGLPQGMDIDSDRTLGLRLVRSLTQQLDASLEIDTSPLTVFRLSFQGQRSHRKRNDETPEDTGCRR